MDEYIELFWDLIAFDLLQLASIFDWTSSLNRITPF